MKDYLRCKTCAYRNEVPDTADHLQHITCDFCKHGDHYKLTPEDEAKLYHDWKNIDKIREKKVIKDKIDKCEPDEFREILKYLLKRIDEQEELIRQLTDDASSLRLRSMNI